MQLIKDLYRAVLEAFIRFWENCFRIEDEKFNLLSMELEKERQEKNKLIDVLIELSRPNTATEPEVDTSRLEPIMPQRVPWHVRARQLEEQQRIKAQQLRNHPEASNKVTSVEDLEKELNIGVGEN